MKIRIEDDSLGTFTWDTPAKFDEQMADIASVLRNRMHLSENDVDSALRVYIEEIERRIRGLLALLTAVVHLSGPKRLIIDALIDEGMKSLTIDVHDTLHDLQNATAHLGGKPKLRRR